MIYHINYRIIIVFDLIKQALIRSFTVSRFDENMEVLTFGQPGLFWPHLGQAIMFSKNRLGLLFSLYSSLTAYTKLEEKMNEQY